MYALCFYFGRTHRVQTVHLIILCPIDHSHIVLIIGDLNGLGHLPEFADQNSSRQILVNGPTRSDRRNQYNMRMVYSAKNDILTKAMSYDVPKPDL